MPTATPAQPRWDELQVRAILRHDHPGVDVRPYGWHVLVRAAGEPEAGDAQGLLLDRGVALERRGLDLVVSIDYPTCALNRMYGSAWERPDRVGGCRHRPRHDGTVTPSCSCAKAQVASRAGQGQRPGRGYRPGFDMGEAGVGLEVLPRPVRPVDADHLERLRGDVSEPAFTVTSAAQRSALHAAAAHPAGSIPASASLADLELLQARGLARRDAGDGWTITSTGRRVCAVCPREHVVVVPCSATKLESVLAEAQEMYAPGAYHRAALKAARAMTAAGGRVVILSGRYGFLDPADVILTYEQRVDAPGSVTSDVLHRQAHAMALSGAQVTVLAGRAYRELVKSVWPSAADPLARIGGIGRHLAYFADRYDPDRHHRSRTRVRTAA